MTEMLAEARAGAFPRLLDVEAEHRAHPRTFSTVRPFTTTRVVPSSVTRMVANGRSEE
jgi:hypothetical protein